MAIDVSVDTKSAQDGLVAWGVKGVVKKNKEVEAGWGGDIQDEAERRWRMHVMASRSVK
jgi:hypothetical protein